MTMPVQFEGALTIATIAEAFDRVRDALQAEAPFALDVAGVTHIDGAGLQLLMLAAREARSAGGSLVLEAPSPAVQAALAAARLGRDLMPEATA